MWDPCCALRSVVDDGRKIVGTAIERITIHHTDYELVVCILHDTTSSKKLLSVFPNALLLIVRSHMHIIFLFFMHNVPARTVCILRKSVDL